MGIRWLHKERASIKPSLKLEAQQRKKLHAGKMLCTMIHENEGVSEEGGVTFCVKGR